MPPSLSSKLRCLRRTLRSKVKPLMLMDFDNIKVIARHMPKTTEHLSSLIPASFVTAYGEKILEVTMQHERDQEKFEDCVQEINAFLRGGLPGMNRLDRVYMQILKHFDMENEIEEVLDACKIYVHPEQNRLKRKRFVEAEEEVDFQNLSQI